MQADHGAFPCSLTHVMRIPSEVKCLQHGNQEWFRLVQHNPTPQRRVQTAFERRYRLGGTNDRFSLSLSPSHASLHSRLAIGTGK